MTIKEELHVITDKHYLADDELKYLARQCLAEIEKLERISNLRIDAIDDMHKDARQMKGALVECDADIKRLKAAEKERSIILAKAGLEKLDLMAKVKELESQLEFKQKSLDHYEDISGEVERPQPTTKASLVTNVEDFESLVNSQNLSGEVEPIDTRYDPNTDIEVRVAHQILGSLHEHSSDPKRMSNMIETCHTLMAARKTRLEGDRLKHPN